MLFQFLANSWQFVQEIGWNSIFGLTQPNPSSNELVPIDEFFNKMRIHDRISLDTGSKFTIDAIPDARFMTAYFLSTTTFQFPDLDIKCKPFITPVSLTGYKMLTFYASILVNDIYNRSTSSVDARAYQHDPRRSDYLSRILRLHVTEGTAHLIESFTNVNDLQRNLENFVPTLAGMKFLIAFDLGFATR